MTIAFSPTSSVSAGSNDTLFGAAYVRSKPARISEAISIFRAINFDESEADDERETGYTVIRVVGSGAELLQED